MRVEAGEDNEWVEWEITLSRRVFFLLIDRDQRGMDLAVYFFVFRSSVEFVPLKLLTYHLITI